MTIHRLRVEETPPKPAAALQPVQAPAASNIQDVEHWRKMAINAGDRLAHAENQAEDLRRAADEARARFGKYKQRLDSAQQRNNQLQVELIKACAERDSLRDQLARQDVLSRRVHEFRQSILDGPLWDLFVELAVSPPAAGVEQKP